MLSPRGLDELAAIDDEAGRLVVTVLRGQLIELCARFQQISVDG